MCVTDGLRVIGGRGRSVEPRGRGKVGKGAENVCKFEIARCWYLIQSYEFQVLQGTRRCRPGLSGSLHFFERC